MTMTPAAREPPSRGVNRDTSMRLNQVFDGKQNNNPYGNQDDHDHDDGGNDQQHTLENSMSSSTRRNRQVDRSRSGKSRQQSSNNNQRLHSSMMQMDRSEPDHGMEEDVSIQSSLSSSRRAAGRGGRHRLTSASGRRTSHTVSQDSILGLSTNLMKAINGREDEEDEELLMEEKRPVLPRTRSKLSDRVRSRRSIHEGGSVVTSESFQSNHSKHSNKQPPSTRRHHSMKVDRGEKLEKSNSTRKLKPERTKARPRRTKSYQVEPAPAAISKSTSTHGSLISTDSPAPTTQPTQSTSRRNDSTTQRRTSRRSQSRPGRSESVDKRGKEAAVAAAQEAQLKKSKGAQRKAAAHAAAEAAQVKKSSGAQRKAAATAAAQAAKARRSKSKERNDEDPAMDGSRKSRHQRNADMGSKRNSSNNLRRTRSINSEPSNSNHARRKPTKEELAAAPPLRRKHTTESRASADKHSPRNKAKEDRRSKGMRKQPSKRSTCKDTSSLVSPISTARSTVDHNIAVPVAARLPDMASPRAKKGGSRGSFNETYVVMNADGSGRTGGSKKGNEIEDDPERTTIMIGAGTDFQAEFHDSDLSESDDDDHCMSMSSSMNDSSRRRSGDGRRRDSGDRRRDSGDKRRGSGGRRHSSGKDKSKEKKRRSNDTGVSSLAIDEESIGDFADFGNSQPPDEKDEFKSSDDDVGAGTDDDDGFFNDNAGMGDILQFDPTQIGMVQRVKQISSDKPGYEINGQTGQIGEIVDPVSNLQDFRPPKGPLFNLFDDDPGFGDDEFNPNQPINKQSSKDGGDSDSPVSHRRKSLFRRAGKKKNEEENEDDEDDDSSSNRRDFISPTTLGYEDPRGVLSPKEKSKSTLEKASGYLRNIIHNASYSDFTDLDDDKSVVSGRSNRSGKSSKSARKSITSLFLTKKKDKGTLLQDEGMSLDDDSANDGGDLLYK